MKFYNPFKPHIVEYAPGLFTVRKLPWYFPLFLLVAQPWLYKDRFYGWHTQPYDPLYAIEEAKQRLNYKKPEKFKPKIYTV